MPSEEMQIGRTELCIDAINNFEACQINDGSVQFSDGGDRWQAVLSVHTSQQGWNTLREITYALRNADQHEDDEDAPIVGLLQLLGFPLTNDTLTVDFLLGMNHDATEAVTHYLTHHAMQNQ